MLDARSDPMGARDPAHRRHRSAGLRRAAPPGGARGARALPGARRAAAGARPHARLSWPPATWRSRGVPQRAARRAAPSCTSPAPSATSRARRVEELDGLATWRLLRAAERARVEHFAWATPLGATPHHPSRVHRTKALAAAGRRRRGASRPPRSPRSLLYAPGDRRLTRLERLGAAAGRAADRPRRRAHAAAVGRGRRRRRRRGAGPRPARAASTSPAPSCSPTATSSSSMLRAARRRRRLVPVPLAVLRPALTRCGDAGRADHVRDLGRGADARRADGLPARRRPTSRRSACTPRRMADVLGGLAPRAGAGAPRGARSRSAWRPGAACPRRAACRRSARWSGRLSSPKPIGTEIAGCPVTLNSEVKGVKRPERARSSIGCSPSPLQSPIAQRPLGERRGEQEVVAGEERHEAARQRLQLGDRAEVADRGHALGELVDRARERLDLVVLRRPPCQQLAVGDARAPRPGPKTADEQRERVAAGQRRAPSPRPRGRARRAARRPGTCRARTPGRRRPRARWRPSSRSAAARGRGGRRCE